MSRNPKAEAWRVAASIVREYGAGKLLFCDDSHEDAKDRALALHLRDVIAPSLRRRADIIGRRETWAKRRKGPRS